MKLHEVTWYSRLAAIFIFVGALPTLSFYIGMQYKAFQHVEAIYTDSLTLGMDITNKVEDLGEYGYRCGDGSEFTIRPSHDLSTMRIIPATSVERFKEATLWKEVSASGVRYSGEGINFTANGETLALNTVAVKTICTPMQDSDSAPFNFGD